MISVFGDESSSTAHATYGLLAIVDVHLPLLDRIASDMRRVLHASTPEPLHSRVLFHGNHRQKSAYKNASLSEVEDACAVLIQRVAALEVAFYFGSVDRNRVPKVLHVPLIDGDNENHVLDARLKLELPHLQFFAYGAAATRACHTLPRPAGRLIVDRNRSVVQWFNEKRQASRLLEVLGVDATLPHWPAATLDDDAKHSGLQVADILTYFATKQYSDSRFGRSFDAIRHKSNFMTYEFSSQVFGPYVAPSGVTVSPLPKKSKEAS